MRPVEIRLLDAYGGAHLVPVGDYFQGSEEVVAPVKSGPRALRLE